MSLFLRHHSNIYLDIPINNDISYVCEFLPLRNERELSVARGKAVVLGGEKI